jgi:hypothetical protein
MKRLSQIKRALLTFDWDWAPDTLIEPIIDQLIASKIPSIWFVTHNTPLLGKLRRYSDLFELGIHPNFFKGSSQGATEDEIIVNMLKIVPEARSVRTHGLYQYSNLILKLGSKYGLEFDFSIFLPNSSIQPHQFIFGNQSITRFPYNWEDDIAMFDPKGLEGCLNHILSLNRSIFDFHPIHVALNSKDLDAYNCLKNIESNLEEWTQTFCDPYIKKEVFGIQNTLNMLIEEHQNNNILMTLDNFYNL